LKIPKSKTRLWSTDTETTGIYPWTGARPFYFSFCNPEGDTAKCRWKVDPFTRVVEPVKADLEQMRDYLEDERNTFAMQNSPFDIRMYDFTGIKIKARVEDTYFAAHTLRTNELTHALKPLCKKYLDFSDADEKGLEDWVKKERNRVKKLGWNIATKEKFGKQPHKADYWLAPDKVLDPYGCGDAERAMLLWLLLRDELKSDPLCDRFYQREIQLRDVTYEMVTRGVRVRREVITQNIAAQRAEIAKCRQTLDQKIGKDFNPASDKQIAHYAYDVLKFPVKRWTDGGSPSVDSKALQGMDHPVIKTIRQYNSAEKSITNFFQKYLNTAVLDEEGCWILHPDFNQVGPATGRYSCRNPNLQNAANALSTRSDIPIQARTPFCPRPGYVWLCPDYAGQEIWIFADGSKGAKMLDALYAGRDIHDESARFVWGDEQVEKEKREGKKTSRARAKMFFFGIIYGMGAKSMAEFLGCGKMQAEETLEKYYNFFPNIQPFMRQVVRQVQKQGFIQTAWGRKIFVDKEFAYKATNYFVQGTGADVIKDAMLHVDVYFKAAKLDAHLVMTIHDELVIEIRREQLTRRVAEKIKSLMEDHGGNLGIPRLPVELARVTKRWDLKEEHLDPKTLPN
jgi:DNA polymerase-1